VLSVVIPCRDDAGRLADQLDALAGQRAGEPFEVIVVDDGSTDGTADVARAYTDRLRLRVISLDGGPCVGRARNAGAAAAEGSRLVFLDADDVAAPGYLAAMGAALDRHLFVAARLDAGRLNPPWLRRSRPVPQATGLNHDLGFLPYALGGSIGVVRSAFEAAGGFPTRRQYGDDVELCWTLQLAGVQLHWVPDAVLHYRFRVTARAAFDQGRRYGRSNASFYRQFRRQGMRRSPWAGRAVHWLGFGPRLLLWWRPGPRLALAHDAGVSVGRLLGSIEQRVVYP
jgi:glycosyltransferase involved in cell wall biosynthesis